MSWKLAPSAHRRQPILESQMAQHFRLRAPGIRSDCPAQMDFTSWLPLMRHYGLPTRLLDWTDSIAIAAFFATYAPRLQKMNEAAAVWLLAPGAFNEIQGVSTIVTINSEVAEPVVSAAFDPSIEAEYDLAVVAPRTDARMTAQRGNFTIHGSHIPLDEHPRSEEFLARVEIPVSARGQFAGDLRSAGLSLAGVFPDLEHLAEEIANITAFDDEVEDLDDPNRASPA